ncbi:MAG: lamin tail domain-containing protein [Candidatus Niyogibacteria bacterium]|nr:lamin tail domain-containing protein [Candidatus Niyogibacteria bacterium]
MIKFLRIFFILLLGIPIFTHAQISFSEIMYDLEGADSGREWVKIFNDKNEAVDLSGWRLREDNTNHSLNLFQGENILSAQGCAIIADNAEKFLIDWPGFSGTIFDSSFSLNNAGEKLILLDNAGNEADFVVYNSDYGAGGDGRSLQKTGETWSAANAVPKNCGQPDSGSAPINQPLNSESSGSIIPLENPLSIKAMAGQDKTAVAGAEMEFKGEAYGLKNEPLENARYLWIFGDGTQKEGKTARHTYYFPGVYQAVLNVSSGYYSVSDYLKITVIANELFISEVKPVSGNSSWIEIHNPSNETIDISYFVLKSQGKKFVFPDSTFILPKSFLVVAESVSAISPALISGEVEFLNSAGSSADLFSYSGLLKVNESFNKINGQTQIIVAFESPGKETAGPPLKQDILPSSLPQKINQPPVVQPSSVKPAVNQDKDIVSAVAANTVKAEEGAKNNAWFWFLASLGMGIFSAVGFVFIKTNAIQDR